MSAKADRARIGESIEYNAKSAWHTKVPRGVAHVCDKADMHLLPLVIFVAGVLLAGAGFTLRTIDRNHAAAALEPWQKRTADAEAWAERLRHGCQQRSDRIFQLEKKLVEAGLPLDQVVYSEPPAVTDS